MEIITFLGLVLAGGVTVGCIAAKGGVGITLAALGWYVLAVVLVVAGMMVSLGEALCENEECTPTSKDGVMFALAGVSLLVSVAVASAGRLWRRSAD